MSRASSGAALALRVHYGRAVRASSAEPPRWQVRLVAALAALIGATILTAAITITWARSREADARATCLAMAPAADDYALNWESRPLPSWICYIDRDGDGLGEERHVLGLWW